MSTGTVREPVFLPQTVGHLLHRAVRTLRRAHIDHADQEAVWLLACALEQSRLQLLLDRARPVTSEASTRAEGLVRRRAAGEPLQYLLGTQEFCGLDFEVNPDVLIPRPETEVLVEETLRLVSGLTATAPAGPAGPVVVDLGTGSGCLAVALARALPTARLYATDQSCAALKTARRNAARHGVSHRITFCEGDLLVPLRAHQLTGRVSALVSNPPYIPEHELAGLPVEVRDFEPREALAGGADGLAVHRRLLQDGWEFLRPGGVLVMEVGAGQADLLRQTVTSQRQVQLVSVTPDQAGIERVLGFRRVA